jgi:anthranilate synthase
MSPGPGSPSDFNCSKTIAACLERNLPIFGVCLGLQALVEYFGGVLDILDTPMHGKPSMIHVASDTFLFQGMGESFVAARYHSLYARQSAMPACLKVIGHCLDQDSKKETVSVIMGIEHVTLPIGAVQFHPESILTSHADGMKIVVNMIERIKGFKK